MAFLDSAGTRESGGSAPAPEGNNPRPRTNAERRAAHNAVERERREQLNAQLLDLAALLPNLAHVQRPSKDRIVHATRAYVRAAGRHRALAAQQLHVLAEEAASLRREVDGWRARAGVSPLPVAPRRTPGFAAVLAAAEADMELEFEPTRGFYEPRQAGEGGEDEEDEEVGCDPSCVMSPQHPETYAGYAYGAPPQFSSSRAPPHRQPHPPSSYEHVPPPSSPFAYDHGPASPSSGSGSGYSASAPSSAHSYSTTSTPSSAHSHSSHPYAHDAAQSFAHDSALPPHAPLPGAQHAVYDTHGFSAYASPASAPVNGPPRPHRLDTYTQTQGQLQTWNGAPQTQGKWVQARAPQRQQTW
ncbi:hypothetical protein B0H15DRAFT_953176 [Mycena belliarum]|uniref:BHLH domain-containing protein n=1 Tax=Mycena belliarum TaxID=1033014 RepID=A0AAD6XIH8_9AGAR|nr:hypothetical protein B0H15DRAFT_953176 [Mycena belliae]